VINKEKITRNWLKRYTGTDPDALLLVSDTPMTPEGVKTEVSDIEVTRKYVDLHLEMGIEAMTRIGDEGEKIKHFTY